MLTLQKINLASENTGSSELSGIHTDQERVNLVGRLPEGLMPSSRASKEGNTGIDRELTWPVFS